MGECHISRERIQLGKEGEAKAVEFLERNGFVILETNFRRPCGELDVIAQDHDTLCFIEVRTRTSEDEGHPFETITPTKKQKIIRTAISYLQEKGDLDVKSRFDVVAVIPDENGHYQIELLKNAFEVGR